VTRATVRRVESEHETVVESPWFHADCCPWVAGDVTARPVFVSYQQGTHRGHMDMTLRSAVLCLNSMCSTCELTSSCCTTRIRSTAASLRAHHPQALSSLLLKTALAKPSTRR
jgi:hypothetical protein